MKTEILEIKVALQILKPASEVFEAIINPAKMSNYFIAESSGKMEQGKQVMWKFPEFEERFPIQVVKIEDDKAVAFNWAVNGKDMQVEITLEAALNPNYTIVRISEKEMENNEAGISWLKGNTEGWANFLSCMKAYLEYGINLRKGAFDFLNVNPDAAVK